MSRFFIPLLLILGFPAFAADAADTTDMTGKWVLNQELTEAAQPKNREKKGLGNVSIRPVISVGGYGFPIPGLPGSKSGTPPVKGAAKNPNVLYADTIDIQVIDGNIVLDFNEVGTTELKPGKDHGTRTRWTGRKLTSKYQSTSRKVSQEYAMKGDELLVVTVRIKPGGSSKKVYKKIFQRPE